MSRLLILVCYIFSMPGRPYAQQVLLPDSIVCYFPFNDCRISSVAMDQLHEWLSAHDTSKTFTVSGYTDQTGSVQYNKRLSRCRADAVAQTIQAVVKKSETEIVAYGESFPASNTIQRLNRRVVISTTPNITVIKIKDSSIVQRPAIRDSGFVKMDTAIHIKQILEIENILFFPDKASILPESQVYLKELAQTLLRFPADVNFEIRGFVNCPVCKNNPDNPRNRFYQLSKDRAKEVYLWLESMGVPAARMRPVGMGWLNMLYPEPKSEAEMRKNMRVEIAVY